MRKKEMMALNSILESIGGSWCLVVQTFEVIPKVCSTPATKVGLT